ncbi:MAG: hypothetical protein ACTSUD_03050 [Alphaproteobacteria bacterium]
MLSLTATLIILAACVAVLVAGQIRERRRYKPGRISLIPWVPLQFLAMLGVMLMLAHVISLVSGKPFIGRFAR